VTTDPWGAAWPAPAKLNLFLHVIGRRADGYHLLQTAFRFLDHGDALYFQLAADGLIRRHAGIAGVPEEQDLVVRAARLLQAATGCAGGALIRNDKQLPMGGGLGGGSSDAATTLVALNRLWGLDLDVDSLAELGLRLGADVPVFIRGRAAWAEGVGERLTPIRLPPAWYVVLVPDCHVNTADIFHAPELTRNTLPLKMSAFSFGMGRNDCAPVVCRRHPLVARALAELGRHCEARMTGTGACVFGAMGDEAQAGAVLRACQKAGWSGFIARGLDQSPLLDRLNAMD